MRRLPSFMTQTMQQSTEAVMAAFNHDDNSVVPMSGDHAAPVEDSDPFSESAEESDAHVQKGRAPASGRSKKMGTRISSRFQDIHIENTLVKSQRAEEDPAEEMAALTTTLPAVLRQQSGHIVILAMGELLLQQLEALIKPLRYPWLLVWTEIVIVCEQPMERLNGIYEGVHFIYGSPIRHQALSLAGVEDASKVVILDSSVVKTPTVSDYNTVMVYGVLDSYLEWKGATDVSVFTALNTIDSIKQLAMNSNLVVTVERDARRQPSQHKSFHRARAQETNMGMAAKSRIKSSSNKLLLKFRPSVNPAVFPPQMHPQFVSGCSMFIADLVSWFGQSYHTPGYMELMEALLLPSEVRKIEQGWHASMVWMMSPKKVQRCKTWGTLVDFCMAGGAIPMALSRYIGEDHRAVGSSDAGQGIGTSKDRYIITNPPPDCALVPDSDEAMVLAPPRWAYANCIDAQIVQIYGVTRDTRDLKAMLREWRAMVKNKVSRNRIVLDAEQLRNASDTSDDEASGREGLIDADNGVHVTSADDTRKTASIDAIREQLLSEIDKQHNRLRAMVMTALP